MAKKKNKFKILPPGTYTLRFDKLVKTNPRRLRYKVVNGPFKDRTVLLPLERNIEATLAVMEYGDASKKLFP